MVIFASQKHSPKNGFFCSAYRPCEKYGAKFFTWVECKENDGDLFEVKESEYYYPLTYDGEKEDQTTRDERDKRLLFTNYDMLRASGRVIYDDGLIELYNSILNIDYEIEREILF